MHFRKTVSVIAVVLACVGGLALTAGANSNNQIVLSATGITTSVGPGGFWLWSQPGGNSYGNDGQGNAYFYALGIQKPVEVTKTVLSGATVTEHVASKDGSIVCDFSATETSRPSSPRGANGVVSFTCSAPAGASVTNVPATVRISSF